jgi:hypothetical protein
MRAIFALAVIGMLAAMPAWAGPVWTYSYQGQPFDGFYPTGPTNPFSTANAVTFSFETSIPIAHGTTYTLYDGSAINPTLLSWQVSDGSQSFSSATDTFGAPGYSTDGGIILGSNIALSRTGQIVSWFFGAEQVGGGFLKSPNDQLGVTIESCGPDPCIESVVGPTWTTWYAGDYDQYNLPGGPYGGSGGADTPGTWTIIHPCCGHGHDPDPVPEPSSLALILPAIGVMIGLRGMSRAVLKFARQASLVDQATRPWLAVQGRGCWRAWPDGRPGRPAGRGVACGP